MRIRRRIRHILQNITLPRTKKLYLCFDSDDWGATRVPSKEVLDNLEKEGEGMLSNAFTSLDGLETDRDVSDLIKVLTSFSDSNGKHPVFTLNMCAYSPDYKKITLNNFEKYFHQKLEDIYKTTIDSSKCLSKIFQGIEENVFDVQMHCAEHINVSRWMKELQSSNRLKKTCSYSITSTGSMYDKEHVFAYMDEMNVFSHEQISFLEKSISEGKKYLSSLFIKRMESITPSCGVMPKKYEEILSKNNFLFSKGSFKQFKSGNKHKITTKLILKSHYYGARFVVRNCTFEPSLNEDALNDCFEDISFAFKHNKPCIISSHRINYTSRISIQNKLNSLKLLKQLLKQILEKYPDVVFVSTDELTKIILKRENK